MRAWMVDANDIREDDQIPRNAIHETASISQFLDQHRVTKHFLVATKGFGKTLLLKSKRLLYGRSGVRWIPANQLLDKPLGAPRVFTQAEIKEIINDDTYWTQLWLLSILCSILKDYSAEMEQHFCSKELKNLVAAPHIRTPADFFVSFLNFSRSQYFDARTDLNGQLTPRFRSYNVQTAVFLDNIDEFLDVHLRAERLQDSVTGPLDKSLWYEAQIGLVYAVWQLSGANQHVKIYCSVRKEAFSKLSTTSSLYLQIAGASLDIEYSKEDLLDIFAKNVRQERSPNLKEPRKVERHPFVAFFGSDCTILRHQFTGETEGIADYIYRHTLGRPRDFVQVGSKLSEIRPGRRNADEVRKAVNSAATEILKQYLSEITPHIGEIDFERLYALLPKNMLSRTDVEDISRKYDQGIHGDNHVFCNLYKVGLLGIVHFKTGCGIQQFAAPGRLTFEKNGILPDADCYVIHPALDHLVDNRSRNYFRLYDRINIAGNERRWVSPGFKNFVVQCDIKGYSNIMADSDVLREFDAKFKELFSRLTSMARYARMDRGDSWCIIDQNGHFIVDTLRCIERFLSEFEHPTSFRAGGEFGVVEFENDQPRSCDALRTAARLESIAIPGCLVMTSDFAEEIKNRFGERPEKWHTPSLPQNERAEVNVAKNAQDRPTWRSLFFLKLKD